MDCDLDSGSAEIASFGVGLLVLPNLSLPGIVVGLAVVMDCSVASMAPKFVAQKK